MAYVIFSLFLFCASVMLHVLFCRHSPESGLQARAYIFIALLGLGLYAMSVYLVGPVLDTHSFWGMPFKISAGFIFVLLVPVYLSFYVLTQLMSPSKRILLAIARTGEASYADILDCIKKEDFIMTRLNDLCSSGCVTLKDGRYRLTAEGHKIAVALDTMQFVLGRQVGG